MGLHLEGIQLSSPEDWQILQSIISASRLSVIEFVLCHFMRFISHHFIPVYPVR